MDIRRTPYAFAIAAVSLGLLAACSDDADRPKDAPAEQVTPAPSTPPTQGTTPAPSVAPDTGTTMPAPSAAPDTGTTMPPPVEPSSPPATSPSSGTTTNPVPESTPSTTPAPSSSSAPGLTQKLASSSQTLQDSARSAAHTFGEKAGELRDVTGERISQVGHAIRDGAAHADATIQQSFQKGGQPTQNGNASVGS